MTRPKTPAGVDPEWLHALRNAVNGAACAASAARSALDAGEPARAREFLRDSEAACRRAGDLMGPTTQSPPIVPGRPKPGAARGRAPTGDAAAT